MRIAYVGGFQFPEGDAGAQRVMGIGKVIRELGHTVVFFGIDKQPADNNTQANSDSLSFRGFKYYLPNLASISYKEKIYRQLAIQRGSFIFDNLLNEEKSNGLFDVIIAYQAPTLTIFRLLRWCRQRNIPLICDTVEWYDRTHVMGGRFGPYALDSELRMRKIQQKSDGIIAISTYLEEYYKSTSRSPVVRVPPLFDLTEKKKAEDTDAPLTDIVSFVYAGNAGKKDLIVNAIRGLAKLDKEAESCKIILIGPSINELIKNLGSDADLLARLNESISFTGRLSHQAAINNVAQSDFSLLLRPDARFAHAGFPTKLVESLAMGVPVICNLTSDIGIYVHDGKEGIILKDCSPESFAEGVKRALALTIEERKAMRKHARKCAEDNFDYRNWIEPISGFLEKVITKKKFNIK